MTCIVGLVDNGDVWIGGDSAGTSQSMHQRIRGDKKVFQRGEFLIGFCGSFRVGQLLRHTLEVPAQRADQEDVTFLVTDFVASVKKLLADDSQEPQPFLFGYRGGLYALHQDFQIAESKEGFDAVGSGADIAMGALHLSTHVRDPKLRIEAVLKASATNNAAVRPPFVIKKLRWSKGR